MKMTKPQLKALIKECLVEILNEGLNGSLSVSEGSQKTTRQDRTVSPKRNLNQVSERHVPVRQFQNQQYEAVKIASAGNPILESIMADTAATTYLDQQNADRPGRRMAPMGGVELQVDQSTPEQLFGEEATSNWIAIMDRIGVDGG